MFDCEPHRSVSPDRDNSPRRSVSPDAPHRSVSPDAPGMSVSPDAPRRSASPHPLEMCTSSVAPAHGRGVRGITQRGEGGVEVLGVGEGTTEHLAEGGEEEEEGLEEEGHR